MPQISLHPRPLSQLERGEIQQYRWLSDQDSIENFHPTVYFSTYFLPRTFEYTNFWLVNDDEALKAFGQRFAAVGTGNHDIFNTRRIRVQLSDARLNGKQHAFT